jgi:hypothetical protein
MNETAFSHNNQPEKHHHGIFFHMSAKNGVSLLCRIGTNHKIFVQKSCKNPLEKHLSIVVSFVVYKRPLCIESTKQKKVLPIGTQKEWTFLDEIWSKNDQSFGHIHNLMIQKKLHIPGKVERASLETDKSWREVSW